MEDIQVAIIGTGQGQIVQTPPGQPNIETSFVGPVRAIAIRFVYLFLTVFVGAFTSPILGMPASDIKGYALIALSAALVGLGKDLITVFGKLETKYPLATGSV